jgi:CheY-like chemotaxis protein
VAHKVLLVEDDIDIRQTLAEILLIEGYEVVTATNGKEGLQLLRESVQPPCLILLDLMMPVMNGWEFLEFRKGDQALATIPVVVVSARGERKSPEGAEAYIKKPVELINLLTTVKQYCPV